MQELEVILRRRPYILAIIKPKTLVFYFSLESTNILKLAFLQPLNTTCPWDQSEGSNRSDWAIPVFIPPLFWPTINLTTKQLPSPFLDVARIVSPVPSRNVKDIRANWWFWPFLSNFRNFGGFLAKNQKYPIMTVLKKWKFKKKKCFF